jgi:aryl-alcohol dehydrogenase-like predicted oxidoreductase
MNTKRPWALTRRDFMRLSATATVLSSGSSSLYGMDVLPPPMKRRFGRIDFDVTTMGLGGQAAIQWTPGDVDPVAIITKALALGINYIDTSNAYGPSQSNFGKAFRKLNLVPGRPGYDRRRRESTFVATKTMVRWAEGGYPTLPNVRNYTHADPGGGAVADLRRSLSQLFGDDNGAYADEAYVDLMLIHNVVTFEEVDAVYKGLYTPVTKGEPIGALAALRDYRDGTNRTGLNPGREKRIRHLGFSGHHDAAVMIEMIQRDRDNLLDAMLVSINVNDRRYLNMQHNVIPVAQAKNMGIIGMKVFADGAMYTKPARWSGTPADVVRLIGTKTLPSKPLIEYALTTPGIHTLIIGIGEIDEDPSRCQLVQDYCAAQIREDALTAEQRREMESLGLRAKDGRTNWFQQPDRGLTPPRNARIERGGRIRLTWDTAYAGDEPLSHYVITCDGRELDTVRHAPQTSKTPFSFEADAGREFSVASVDAAGRRASTGTLQ